MRSFQLLNILFTIITILVNGAANALPINGQTSGEISDRFPIYFVPAGYVFAIWGLIYLGLLAFTIYQALPSLRENKTLQRISPFYWLASIANCVWLFLWHYERFPLTIVAMVVLLVSLIIIFLILQKTAGLSKVFRLLVNLPFSIYLGWISVATIANASQLLYFLEWDAWGISGEVWAFIMLLVATLLGLLMLWLFRNVPFSLVLVWAFVGIAQAQSDSMLVSYAALTLAGLLLLATIVIPLIQYQQRRAALRAPGI